MSQRVKESIFIGHRVTNPILFGVKEEGQLGARNELDLAYEIFTNTYVAERQNTLLRTIKKLAFYEIQNPNIEILSLKPIDTVDLTSDIILANLSREEIRTMITAQTGLELIEEQTAPTQMSKIDEDKEKMSACGCFSTNEDTNFFAGMGEPESDYEVIDSFDINFKEDGSPINFATEQQGIIQRILTLILTNPLIASSGIAEALGLDFEQLISSMSVLKKSNLIEIEGSTIGLTPVGDRVAKAIEVPQTEVKYRYELRKNAPALKPGGKSRKFCDDLMQTPTQLYTREQIDAMNNKMKSSGYPKVADVWLARGGWYRRVGTETSIPFCRHIWKQVIVRKKDSPSNDRTPIIKPSDNAESIGDKMPLVLDYEGEIRNNKIESAGIYDLNGNLILKKKGDKNSVPFTLSEQFLMRDKVLTHNHPVEVGFSNEDIEIAFYNKIKEIRAVTGKYTYSLTPTSDLSESTIKEMMKEYKKTSKLVRVKLTDEYNSGKISISEFRENYDHEQIIMLSKTRFGKYFKYSRK